jgi:hypothetical protein
MASWREALREHRVRQSEERVAARLFWQIVGWFASAAGTPIDDHNVRRRSG